MSKPNLAAETLAEAVRAASRNLLEARADLIEAEAETLTSKAVELRRTIEVDLKEAELLRLVKELSRVREADREPDAQAPNVTNIVNAIPTN